MENNEKLYESKIEEMIFEINSFKEILKLIIIL